MIFTRCRLDLPDTCALYQIDVNGGGPTAITNFELGIVDLHGKYSATGTLAFIGVAREGIFCAIYLGARFSIRDKSHYASCTLGPYAGLVTRWEEACILDTLHL